MNTDWVKRVVYFVLAGCLLPSLLVAKDTKLSLETPAVEIMSEWSDMMLVDYMRKSNQPETCFLHRLTVRQNKLEKQIYVRTGSEERRRQLSRRPILQPVSGSAPFARKIDYTVRIDRTQSVEIDFRMYRIHETTDGGVDKTSPEKLYVYLKPGTDEETILPLPTGKFYFNLSVQEPCREINFQVRSKDERHSMHLFLLNEKKPFTLETDEGER
ncbi:hypothetical protein K8S19_11380 [bacterium]|nr:hypothetical protein [bacterium]